MTDKNLPSIPPISQSPYSDPPVTTPAETPSAKAARLSPMPLQKNYSPSFYERLRTSFPPNRPTSYGLAATLISLAASSAAGIPNPLHRTLAILLIVVVVYFIGLKTV